MTPTEWTCTMALPWRDRGPHVAAEVRLFLARRPEVHYATGALIEGLWPRDDTTNYLQQLARKRLINLLMRMAPDVLADCATRGQPRSHPRFGTITPWRWQAGNKPEIVSPCPLCGR